MTADTIPADASVPALTDEELARPPRGVSLRRDFGDALTIVCRPRKGTLLFLVPFTALWSGFSLGTIYVVPWLTGRFEWQAALVGIPFLLGTLVLVGAILHLLFAKTTITLAKGRVKLRGGLFGAGRTREFVLRKDTAVSLGATLYKVNNVPQKEIVLAGGGEVFRFGALGLSNEAKTYVAAFLRRAVGGR